MLNIMQQHNGFHDCTSATTSAVHPEMAFHFQFYFAMYIKTSKSVLLEQKIDQNWPHWRIQQETAASWIRPGTLTRMINILTEWGGGGGSNYRSK